MTTQLNPSEATSLALNTLSTQLRAILQMPDGPAKAAIASFEILLAANLTMISDAANEHIDEFNALIGELEARDQEIETITQEHSALKIQSSRLIAARRNDEDMVRKIEATSAQIAHQRDAYKRDAEEGRRHKPELDKAKARLKRLEESAVKREAEHNELKMKLQRTESLLMRAARGVIQAKDTVQNVQHRMMQDGLEAEVTIEVKGVHYYIYRRPCIVAEAFKPTDGQVASRDHMYVFRVETSAGYHWDAIPLVDGDVGIVKQRAMPKEVKQYLVNEYKQSPLFELEHINLRSDEMDQGIGKLSNILAELESIDHNLTPLKVKDSLKQTRARKLMGNSGRKAA
ncbi:hypothetical protein [Aeromonas sp. sif2416]|uniref:hypothetical protein n=1 Tax=Aeromonas sp. sif2416 TaxID=2854793 RepID=UPI001C47387A|nr:hypothetical protein [Aeromonas sp. sif2416]MBV7438935.1 hypothetical protein [Aeromonas sp. sif2416]